MYVEIVPNRKSPPAILLREGWRENGKVKKRTLANLSNWPQPKIEALRRVLKGESMAAKEDVFEIVRSQPHGHVVAVLGTLRKLRLGRLIGPSSPERDRVLAMIVARVLYPGSKLATARGLVQATGSSTLADVLDLGSVDEDDLYAAMDWLLGRQKRIERALAARHLTPSALVLIDLTSVYLEGRKCPLARRGYSRDGKKGKIQIKFALLCDAEGRAVATQVFAGDTVDPMTVGSDIKKLISSFALPKAVLVGDRGMLTEARIREEVTPAGVDWISALTSSAIRKLVEAKEEQFSLFDEKNLLEICSDHYPGERLMVRRNPIMAERRARKREQLLEATEELLEPIAKATRRQKWRLKSDDRIGERVGGVINRYKMAKHFTWEIDDKGMFHYWRKTDSITSEAALDGLYVIRTSLSEDEMKSSDTVRAYKSLSTVERAFRSIKSMDLKVRPVFHRTEDRVRAHVLLCMLAYYVQWLMRQSLAPLLFEEEDPLGAEAACSSVVATAQRSESARRKATRKHSSKG